MCEANSLPVQRRTISRIPLAVMMTCELVMSIGTGFAGIVLTIAEAGSALRATSGTGLADIDIRGDAPIR
jgi:hypothetical protein